jgi:hypothetical protein
MKIRLKVEGHIPRAHFADLPEIFAWSHPNSFFHSSQGISVVSIPDGETVGFWEFPAMRIISMCSLRPERGGVDRRVGRGWAVLHSLSI